MRSVEPSKKDENPAKHFGRDELPPSPVRQEWAPLETYHHYPHITILISLYRWGDGDDTEEGRAESYFNDRPASRVLLCGKVEELIRIFS
jgi:hypothetical protein